VHDVEVGRGLQEVAKVLVERRFVHPDVVLQDEGGGVAGCSSCVAAARHHVVQGAVKLDAERLLSGAQGRPAVVLGEKAVDGFSAQLFLVKARHGDCEFVQHSVL